LRIPLDRVDIAFVNQEGKMLDGKKFGLPCPKCGHKTEQTIAWIKAHDDFVCAGCDETVKLDNERLLADLEEVQKSVAETRKALRRMAKRR